MFSILLICLIISNSFAQFDGQFWWLNSKLDKFRSPPPQPKFEDLSDFETDQSAKIVFKDDLLPTTEKFADWKIDGQKLVKVGNSNQAITFRDRSEILLLNYTKKKSTNPAPLTEIEDNIGNKQLGNDILKVKFPEDEFVGNKKNIDKNETMKTEPVYQQNATNNNNKDNIDSGKITYLTSIVPFKVQSNKPSAAENICTYLKKNDCNRLGGVLYVKHKSDWKQRPFETKLVCCILPMRSELESSKIYFREPSKPFRRCKRSNEAASTALRQRNALLLRRFTFQTQVKATTQKPVQISHRVVTPSDESIDPYWNIKNTNFKKPTNKQSSQHTRYEYDEDYIEDYTVEIPKPGLTGIYSDHGPSKPGWTFPTIRPSYGGIDSDEIDDEPTFGYSPTVDPRTEDRRVTPIPRVSGRPVKISTYADERNFDTESQTISYQSNPDFQVLQGFKLLHLRNRTHRNGKKTATEKFYASDSNEHVLTAPLDNEYSDEVLDSTQVYKDCGKMAKEINRNNENGKEMGDTVQGSHPALALVVLTKRKQSFLCYGTIIHPRVAVTAADCVFGRTAPGEMTVIAGAWRLSEESREEWQKRMATVHIHSLHRPGDLAHNLAVLYWKRPLRLNANVQPACLSDPHVGDDCRFFGWGGYDQAIRKQSKWQRAVVLAPRTCEERVTNKRVPSEAFCASVPARSSVTGIGGPLMCEVSGRQSVAGVAVWRDLAVVLLPAHEWITTTIDDLQID